MKRSLSLMLTNLFILSLPANSFAQDSFGRSHLVTASLMTDSTVGTIDPTLLTFICRTKQNSKPFRVTSSTVFELGSVGSSFPALKPGMTVQIVYHRSGATLVSGTTLVADTVTVTP